MATFQKRGKRWRVMIRRKGWPEQSRTFANKGEAAAWAAMVESEMARGVWIDQSEARSQTLADCLERYAREITPTKKGAPQEADRIKVLKRHPIARLAMANIRGADLAAYRDERLAAGKSPTTVNNELTLLSSCFNVAIKEWGMESLRNPVSLIRRPKQPRGRERRITPDEEARLLDAASPDLRAFLILALETGMRRGELLALRREDVNDNVAWLRDTKNDTARRVPLSSRALAALDTLPRKPGPVFRMTPGAVTHRFQRLARRVGIDDLRLHDLRHEATSRLFERGFNVMEVATITGHKTLNLLQRYTHLRAEDLVKRLE